MATESLVATEQSDLKPDPVQQARVELERSTREAAVIRQELNRVEARMSIYAQFANGSIPHATEKQMNRARARLVSASEYSSQLLGRWIHARRSVVITSQFIGGSRRVGR